MTVSASVAIAAPEQQPILSHGPTEPQETTKPSKNRDVNLLPDFRRDDLEGLGLLQGAAAT